MDATIAIGLDDVEAAPSVVAIGFFDGVHRGHQSLIARTLKIASERDARAVVVTFDRHPMEVVNPGARPPLLMTLEQRLAALAAQDVDLVVALPFDDSLRHLSPMDFVDHVLAGPLQATHVVVGANFRFGPVQALERNKGFGIDAALSSLTKLKREFGDAISWADLITLAGSIALESHHAAHMPFCPGRTDAHHYPGDEALVYAGAGIVRGSKAAAEREEVRSKMRNFVSLLPAAAPLAASPFSSLPNPNALFCSVLLEELRGAAQRARAVD